MKRTVAEIVALTGPIVAKVDLGEGYSAPVTIDGSRGAAPTVDIEDLTGAVLDGMQPTDKAGLIKIGLPAAPITADGKLTAREAKRSARRTPEAVAACLYASVGMDIPDDLLPGPKPEGKPAEEPPAKEPPTKPRREVKAALAPNGESK
jgi:hypothetical protein